jgi:hypothetical protein
MSEQQAITPGGPTVKKFMFVNRKAPYGTIYALESLEVVLITATFDQDVSLVFIDDGVYELVKGQQTKGIGIRERPAGSRGSPGCPANGATHGATGCDPELLKKMNFHVAHCQ